MPNCEFLQDAEDAAGFAPSFVEKPRIIPNESGTLITMKCKCRAKPKPEVTWFRGTNAVKQSSKITIKSIDVEEDIYELTLEIKVNSIDDNMRIFVYTLLFIFTDYIIIFRIPRARMVVHTDVTFKMNLARAMQI